MTTNRRARCGDFHSIKWYKENRRVFVYSPVVDFSKAEGELLERSSLALDSQVSNLDDWLGLFEVPIPVPNDPA